MSRRIASVVTGAGAIVLLVAKLACSHSQPVEAAPSRSQRPAPPATPYTPAATAQLEALGSPIRSARMWATGLAPNKHGGWNFITQAYEFKSKTPSEFFVVDLDTGKTNVTEGAPKLYTNKKFQIKNQLTAPNGRIFFPELDAAMAYYDPTDETVKELGTLIDPKERQKSFYQATWGPDGKLYLGTQSGTGVLPMIVQLDPDTLKARVIGSVGRDRKSYSFAYNFAVDPPWVYVAVGENPWELAALNIDTGESRILDTRKDEGWMKVEVKPEGVVATLASGLRTAQQHEDSYWCVDGKTVPFQPHYEPSKLPFRARHFATLKRGPLARQTPPEIDLSAITPDVTGTSHVRWRPAGSDEPWKDTPFHVKYTSPVEIDSLEALPDGSVLGNAQQYHGFFRFDPKDLSVTSYGPHGPSRTRHAVVDGIVYLTGYPNGVLYAYDPKKPWKSEGNDKDDRKDPEANPRWVGTFAEARTKYGTALVAATNGRLYYAGRRERDGTGGGVGFYDIAKNRFFGHHDNLASLAAKGLVVLDNPTRIVYSSTLVDDGDGGTIDPAAPASGDAMLVIYDEDLHELGRQIVKPRMHTTGRLYRGAGPNVVIGVLPAEGMIYRYDIAAKQLLDSKQLQGPIVDVVQRDDDRSVWIVLDRSLVRYDAATLTPSRVGEENMIPAGANNLEWQGNDLYFNVKDELYRVGNIGGH